MSLFSKKSVRKVPPECEGMEIKVQSSTCTGERTIGFLDRKTGDLRYKELIRTDADITAFYKSYGLEEKTKK
ncbi:MAG: hypothetical protein IJ737_02310 [Ruminococcus sp.]|nr:hypothetical protein [Ruminococcus sp.]